MAGLEADKLRGDNIYLQRGGTMLHYLYDTSGVCGFTKGDETYYFRKNLQGDVTHVYTSDGTLAAKYSYDAWGNHTVENFLGTVGDANPFRYRGYYFDNETGLYYLKSRYYDPETGRFLNADDIRYLDATVINGLNLFAYCGSSPVMRFDPTGNFALTLTAVGWGLVALIGLLTTSVTI